MAGSLYFCNKMSRLGLIIQIWTIAHYESTAESDFTTDRGFKMLVKPQKVENLESEHGVVSTRGVNSQTV